MIDVEIVGAGFAGLACAEACAARGLRTVVRERKSDPGAACHTTGLLVQEAADEWRVPPPLLRRIGGVRLYSPSLQSIDLESPGYGFFATDTPALLRWLARRAEASGAEVRTRSEYRGGSGARWLVGADGPRSRVARDHGLGVTVAFLAGVEAEYEGVEGVDPDRLHCFLDSRLAPGYIGWVVAGVHATQVGLACLRPHRPRLDRFVRKASSIFGFGRARCLGMRGGLIPVGGGVRPFTKDRVLLVGDAAGLVSPLTAGGIHTALRSGQEAGRAIARHLLEGEPVRLSYPRFLWKRLLRMALDLRPPQGLFDAALSSPLFRALAQAVFFHHRGILSPAAWRDLARVVIQSV